MAAGGFLYGEGVIVFPFPFVFKLSVHANVLEGVTIDSAAGKHSVRPGSPESFSLSGRHPSAPGMTICMILIAAELKIGVSEVIVNM
ncbi:hypothetical protein LTR56_028111 [Elasticomyces elasticus]|nr:hypothetical protein LTR56_028111 [Elasticomyces elasticus]